MVLAFQEAGDFVELAGGDAREEGGCAVHVLT